MKVKSTAAQAAQEIRNIIKEIAKKEGIKIVARVTSENYAGGNSVRVHLTDMPKAIVEQIEEQTAKYEYGSFDGMTDCYNYDNVRKDIPQVRFLFVNNEPSDETRERLFKQMKAERGEEIKSNTLDEFYNEYVAELREWGGTLLHRAFRDL